MGNACWGAPRDGDATLSRTHTPIVPSFLDIVAFGEASRNLEGRLPTAKVQCKGLLQLRIDAEPSLPQGLPYEDVALLASMLPQYTRLRQLVLVHCSIGWEAMTVLAPAIAQCNALESLDLSNNGLTDFSVEMLANALPGCIELRSLGLRENSFGERGVNALAAKLHLLRALDLLMLHGLEASSEVLQRKKLPRLHLCFNDQQTQRIINGGSTLGRTLTPPRPGDSPNAHLVHTFTPQRPDNTLV